MSQKVTMLKYRSPNRSGLWAALFLAPNLSFFLCFTVIPVTWAAVMSFMDWKIIGTPSWIGIKNYIEIFTVDRIFWTVLKNTVIFMLLSVPLGVVLSMFVAILLNQNIALKRLYRGFFFMPVISSSVLISIVWKWLLVPDFGMVNYLLGLLGIRGPNWLTDTRYALPSIIAVSVWKGLGFNMLLFLAGLQGIPDVYYEAFRLDSESSILRTIHITLPLMAPTTFFVVTMAIINSFKVFDIVLMMTDGGPGRATSVLVHYIYQCGFKYFRMGYASALAYILFFIVLLVTIIQFRLGNTKDFSLT